jgi:2-methylcitrate dehydratase PrpD
MSPFQQAKLALGQLMGLPKDALHIYVGLAVFLVAAALTRRPLGSWLPIAAAIAAAVAGEAWDVAETRAAGARIHWDRNWHDIWNTCFWPFLLFLLARYTRLLSRRA